MSLESFIRQEAVQLGFAAVGFASAGPSHSYDRFREWLARGYAGDMAYLARNSTLRAQPALLAPYVKTIIVVAAHYPAARQSGHWSNYALGRDYHDVLRGKLKELAEAIRGQISVPLRSRICVDSAPVLEREWACRAGLGWIGRQGSLVHPEFGCCLFLGELLTDLELEASPAVPNQCGDCRLCVESCPAGAIQADGLVDARRCLSYLTIEHKGDIPAALRPLVKTLFGCDRCTAVCPRNRERDEAVEMKNCGALPTPAPSREGNRNKPAREDIPLVCHSGFQAQLPSLEGRGMGKFIADNSVMNEFRGIGPPLPTPEACLAMTETDFERRFAGTAVHRLGLQRLQRNAAVVIDNQLNPETGLSRGGMNTGS